MQLPITHYMPILTTLLSAVFAWTIYRRYILRGRSGTHLLWWTGGVIVYGLGTFAESYITLLGWNPVIFKFWYIVGALMGGAPLAQGTVWLLLKPKTARRLTIALVTAITIPAIFVMLSPLNLALVDPNLPSGKVFEWQWVRLFSPFINTYAVIFLIGGAILSASRFFKASKSDAKGATLARDRFIGNVYIAVGAMLPGFGGIGSRMGYTEYLYIGELFGIMLIWLGYWYNVRKRDTNTAELEAA
ncbi:MAG: hypothetical protein IID15_07970 [Candidatus Marinimicrobia bacterium]|nr:hypothetical protein [Candidatus Neomarinimicrobiota bacterium]